ncbi:MAG TPA: tetratricopeptide repeat protein [Candidatus Kapabacteria bacterium]|jgi:TolA-binding protein|nr:tetratricopeptide repeat protein [Candidatus Kapabacteria bacterium]HPU23476.1 tetratricopeptide repeat protein [Candidatus Kapabacteria bacterium]
MKSKIEYTKLWRISAAWLIICTFTFFGCTPSAVRTGNKPIKKASVAKTQKQEIPIDDKIAEFEKNINAPKSENNAQNTQNRVLPSLEEQLAALGNEQVVMKNQIANLQKDVEELRYTLNEIRGSLEQSNVVEKRSVVAGIPANRETTEKAPQSSSDASILLSDEEEGKSYIQRTQKVANTSARKASTTKHTSSSGNQTVRKNSVSIKQNNIATQGEKQQSRTSDESPQPANEKVEMTQSLALISQRQYDKAIEELEKVANSTKNEAVRNEAKFLLAESHSQLGNYEQAAEIYSELLKKGSGEKTAEIAIKLADCKIKLGRITEAKNTYREIIEKYPRSEYVPKARKMLQQM